VATSVFAGTTVLIVLTILDVPAALLLALLAGVCDFVPVLGFIVSAVPAVLLALTVSTTTAVIVAAAYGGYHIAENYFIGPKVYGGQLRLSNLAVLLAFAIGAELFGIIGGLRGKKTNAEIGAGHQLMQPALGLRPEPRPTPIES